MDPIFFLTPCVAVITGVYFHLGTMGSAPTALSKFMMKVFVGKQENFALSSIEKSIEMVKQGEINLLQVDYRTLNDLVKILPKPDFQVQSQYQDMNTILQNEAKMFASPRVELAQSVLNWVEGHVLLAKMGIEEKDRAKNTIAYQRWREGYVDLDHEVENLQLDSIRAIKQVEKQLIADAGQPVLANRKQFSPAVLSHMKGIQS